MPPQVMSAPAQQADHHGGPGGFTVRAAVGPDCPSAGDKRCFATLTTAMLRANVALLEMELETADGDVGSGLRYRGRRGEPSQDREDQTGNRCGRTLMR